MNRKFWGLVTFAFFCALTLFAGCHVTYNPIVDEEPVVVYHTVNFSSNGGSDVASQRVENGSKVSVPENPTRENFHFDTWYSDTELTLEFDFETLITSDITLYAGWIEDSAETTDAEPGSDGEGTEGNNEPVDNNETDPNAEPGTENGTDGENGGEGNTGTGSDDNPVSDPPAEETPVKVYYTVTFLTDGGSDIEEQSVENGATVEVPENPTREEHQFAGWYADPDCTVEFDFTSPITSATTLYAKWRINTYTVWFIANGGNGVAPQSVESGKCAEIPENPSWEEHQFAGWYADSGCTVEFNFTSPITSETAVYAKWSKNVYAVTFISNGGSVVASQNVESGECAEIPENPERDEYQFIGWYADSDCTVEFDFASPIKSETTLYAKWLKGFVMAEGTTIEEKVSGSSLFIEGRNLTIGNIVMCDHEVTQAEWAQYMTYFSVLNGAVGKDKNEKDIFYMPQDDYGMGDNFPAYWINWYECVIYCNLRSAAEGLRPAYYMVIDGENVYDVARWAEVSGTNVAKDNNGKYFYNSKGKSNALDNNDTGIHYDTSANGYRLPTEAEWEYVARGGEEGLSGTQTKFSGSNNINDVCWYRTNSDGKAHEVKQKTPNALGIYDMSGNIAEICYDWHGDITSSTGALGAETGSTTIRRGGCWDNSNANDCAVGSRGTSRARYFRSAQGGLRVVCTCD